MAYFHRENRSFFLNENIRMYFFVHFDVSTRSPSLRERVFLCFERVNEEGLKRSFSPVKKTWFLIYFLIALLSLSELSLISSQADLEIQMDPTDCGVRTPSLVQIQKIFSPTHVSHKNRQNNQMVVMIDDFNEGSALNNLGGNSGAWEKDPLDLEESCAEAIVYDEERQNIKNKVLRLTYDVKSKNSAYNGYWTRLNSMDLRAFKALRFWVKGDATTGFTKRFKIELKNNHETGYFYVMGVKERWQEMIIPLKNFHGLNPKSKVEELTIVFEDQMAHPQMGSLYFDDFCLTGSKKTYEKQQVKARAKTYNALLKVLKKEDGQFIVLLEKKVFQYFQNEQDTQTGLIKDRSTPGSPASIAATGFGLVAYCIAEKNGWLSRVEASQKVLKILTTLSENASKEHGFFYHFLDSKTGKRWADSEVSSMDTALLMAGVLFVSQYFPNSEVSARARDLYNAVEWDWMTKSPEELLYMRWTPEKGFSDSSLWNMSAEEMILYLLAMGSPTHPIAEKAWTQWERKTYQEGDFEFIADPQCSLFTNLYSQAFIDFRNQHDAFANYWKNAQKAVLANRAFCISRKQDFQGYGPEGWGISASDGPRGYRAYGAKEGEHDGTLAPYALIASLPLAPDVAFPAIKKMLISYGSKIWGPYGPTSAFNPTEKWFSHDTIGIDEGIMVLMIENYRSELVWKTFMKESVIQNALKKAGFKMNVQKVGQNQISNERIKILEKNFRRGLNFPKNPIENRPVKIQMRAKNTTEDEENFTSLSRESTFESASNGEKGKSETSSFASADFAQSIKRVTHRSLSIDGYTARPPQCTPGRSFTFALLPSQTEYHLSKLSPFSDPQHDLQKQS